MVTQPHLSDDDKRRYARHILLEALGEEGQKKLLSSRVFVIGAGGLGASCLSYLASCGIGHITIADDDVVELSNLNRQIIHETGDIGRKKVSSAADRISELNPDIDVDIHDTRFSEANADALIQNYDLVIDGCDNFQTRYAINNACLRNKIPWLYCAVRGFEAQLSYFPSHHSNACYQCLVPEEPGNRNDCEERGVLGALVGVMGSILAVEAIKALADCGTLYQGRLLRYNALNGIFKESKLQRDPKCMACGK